MAEWPWKMIKYEMRPPQDCIDWTLRFMYFRVYTPNARNISPLFCHFEFQWDWCACAAPETEKCARKVDKKKSHKFESWTIEIR